MIAGPDQQTEINPGTVTGDNFGKSSDVDEKHDEIIES